MRHQKTTRGPAAEATSARILVFTSPSPATTRSERVGQAHIGPPYTDPPMTAPGRRQLITTLDPDPNNWSTRRINAVRAAHPWMRTYLEIGLEYGHTLENVAFPLRTGVDPEPQFDVQALPPGVDIHVGPSDEFFERISPDRTFDLAFIDGLHTFEQTYRDVIHAFDHCPHGVLLIDDVIPSDWISAIPDHKVSLAERRRHGITDLSWHGDVYKVMLLLHAHHPELDWVTITDRGNPQAFVWRRRTRTHVRAVPHAILASLQAVSYDDVFVAGVPASFHPATEAEGLERVIGAISAPIRLRLRRFSLLHRR